MATDLNGVTLNDVCFYGGGPHHVFVIGDWGGVESEGEAPPVPADDRGTSREHHREFVDGVDNIAQLRVADMMRARAITSRPEFIINVGDSFYWGGLDEKCGTPCTEHVQASQWVNVFEKIYGGDGIDGRQWLGVLGNHDYGGYRFDSAWDQVIAYTWGRELPGSQDRWVLPAQYYAVKVWYPFVDEQGLDTNFNVDYFFVDSNVFDAHPGGYDADHNICDPMHNSRNASCGPQGPLDVASCPGWFRQLWAEQVTWLEQKLSQSAADWTIVVTHFPPGHGREDWRRLADQYGIDLILTGHDHNQQVWYNETSNFLAPTAWVVTGGGGGITSSGKPDEQGNDDQYGFVDVTLTKSEITVEMISHGGALRRSVKVHKGGEGDFLPDLDGWKKMAAAEEKRRQRESSVAVKKMRPRVEHRAHADQTSVPSAAANTTQKSERSAHADQLSAPSAAANTSLKAEHSAHAAQPRAPSAAADTRSKAEQHARVDQPPAPSAAATMRTKAASSAAANTEPKAEHSDHADQQPAPSAAANTRPKAQQHAPDNQPQALSAAAKTGPKAEHSAHADQPPAPSTAANTGPNANHSTHAAQPPLPPTPPSAAANTGPQANHGTHAAQPPPPPTTPPSAAANTGPKAEHNPHAAQPPAPSAAADTGPKAEHSAHPAQPPAPSAAATNTRPKAEHISPAAQLRAPSAAAANTRPKAEHSAPAAQLRAPAAAAKTLPKAEHGAPADQPPAPRTPASGANCRAACDLPGAAVPCQDLILWLARKWSPGPSAPNATTCKAAYIEALRACPDCYGCALADVGCWDGGALAQS